MAHQQASVQYYRHLAAPTIHPAPGFNVDQDVDALKKAMKGLGCDEKVILNILCKRSNAQRQKIREAYKLKYGEDLIKELKSELKGDLEDLIVAIMFRPDEYDATELYKAMKGLGTDEDVLVEILATRTNAEIQAIKKAYQQIYEKDLEKDIVGDTSSHFKTFLLSLLHGVRDETHHVDELRAKQDAQQIFDQGVKKSLGEDSHNLNQILAKQNFQQIKAFANEYRKLARDANKPDLLEAIDKDIGGDMALALGAALQIARGREYYYVNRLVKAMKGMGCDDKTLIRAIVGRCERDLLTICQEYERQFANSLDNAISTETSGKYKEALLTLIKPNNH